LMAHMNEVVPAQQADETSLSFRQDSPGPAGRPAEARRLTTLRAGTITIGGRRELCLIRNISAGGLRAHVYSPLREGEEVSVELKTDQQTKGVVSWVDGGTIGVTFHNEIDVEELLASQNVSEGGLRPRMPRVEVDCLGELRIGARIYPINTCDMSQGGARIEVDHPLRVGENIVLTLEKFRPVAGVVRWFEQTQGGVSFNHVIPFHELMNWLRRH